MITMKDSLDGWMVREQRGKPIEIAFLRLPTASKDYLISNKFVTRSFSTEFQFHRDLRTELRRLYKIILVNLRKKFPSLKAGSEAYSIPFAVIRLRYSSLDINSGVKPPVLIRYLRKVGVYDFIAKTGIPISLLPESTDNGFNSRVRISPSDHIENAERGYLSAHLFIFELPVILKMMATLHRRAHLSMGNIPTPTGEVNDDNMPF